MEKVTRLEQIKPKMKIGDYRQVAQIMGCSRDAAKMRLHRDNPEALEVLVRLIESREALAEEFNQKQTS